MVKTLHSERFGDGRQNNIRRPGLFMYVFIHYLLWNGLLRKLNPKRSVTGTDLPPIFQGVPGPLRGLSHRTPTIPAHGQHVTGTN